MPPNANAPQTPLPIGVAPVSVFVPVTVPAADVIVNVASNASIGNPTGPSAKLPSSTNVPGKGPTATPVTV